ncbi:MAG: hypothetical protein V3U93_09480 [Alphaproteobacteria bacterium]
MTRDRDSKRTTQAMGIPERVPAALIALVRLLARQAAREFQTNRNSSVVVSKLHEPEA